MSVYLRRAKTSCRVRTCSTATRARAPTMATQAPTANWRMMNAIPIHVKTAVFAPTSPTSTCAPVPIRTRAPTARQVGILVEIRQSTLLLLDYDDCASNPCQNGGVCSDSISGYSCDCSGLDYNGSQCQCEKNHRRIKMSVFSSDPDQCALGTFTCQNNGTCLSIHNNKNVICQCVNNYEDRNCETYACKKFFICILNQMRY